MITQGGGGLRYVRSSARRPRLQISTTSVDATWCNLHGMVHQVIGRDPDAKGLKPVFKRWLVERTFGALRRWGGLLVDRAGLIEVSTDRLACVAAMAGLEALINPRPAKMMTT